MKPSFKSILREMYGRTGNAEASFTRKMIATLHPDGLIWDSIVFERLGLRLKGMVARAKLGNSIGVYESIVGWYAGYLAIEDALQYIALFDEHLPDYSWLASVKKVDFLLWSAR